MTTISTFLEAHEALVSHQARRAQRHARLASMQSRLRDQWRAAIDGGRFDRAGDLVRRLQFVTLTMWAEKAGGS